MWGMGLFLPCSCPSVTASRRHAWSAGYAIHESRRLPDIAQRVEQPVQFIGAEFRRDGLVLAQDIAKMPAFGYRFLRRVLDQFMGVQATEPGAQRHHDPLRHD